MEFNSAFKGLNSVTWCKRGGGLNVDDWLIVHHSITLFDLQLDAQNSYLFTYNTFIEILYMFRALPCSSSRGLRRNCIYMQPLVSSLSAGDCLVYRLRKNFLNRYTRQSPLKMVLKETESCWGEF